MRRNAAPDRLPVKVIASSRRADGFRGSTVHPGGTPKPTEGSVTPKPGAGAIGVRPAAAEADDVWHEVPRILRRIRPPEFPCRTYDIRDFGAAGDGTTDCTGAFQQAIEACATAGGGRVLVPAGRFLTGP